jgi:hypothetical protein
MLLHESHGIYGRLRANRRIINHGVAWRLGHARAESIPVKRLDLAINEQIRSPQIVGTPPRPTARKDAAVNGRV